MPSTPTPTDTWVPLVDGRKLREAREHRGLSLLGVTRECGKLEVRVDSGNLSRTEGGRRGGISLIAARAVARVLYADTDDLLTGFGRLVNDGALRDARDDRGLTLTEVVAECVLLGAHVDMGSLSRLESARDGGISLDTARALTRVLRIDADDILAESTRSAA